MKKTRLLHLGWLAVLGVIAFASCQVAEETEALKQRFSYECTIEASLPQTRTAIDETGRFVSWVADDALTVIYADPGTSVFKSARFYYSGQSNQFRGNVSNAGASNDWYLLYPYREDNVDASQMHITVQNDPVQEGNDNPAHLCGEFFPLYGKALNVGGGQQGLEINVSHALAYIKYSVYNSTEAPIKVKSIVFAAPVPITGGFVGDLTAQTLTWTPEANASKNLTLTVNEGSEIATGDESFFYAGLIPFTLESGSSVKVKVTAVHPSDPNTEINFYKVISFSQDSEIKPGVYKTIALPFDETHQTDPGDEGPVIKKDQTLSFADDVVTWTLGDAYTIGSEQNMPQEVTGAKTHVDYTSSNTDVIEITAAGMFKIKGIGSTYIKASAIENDEYNPAEKTYTLTVAEAAVVPSSRTYTYVAPNNLTEGTYLIAGSETNELSVALFPNVSTGSWSSQVTGNVPNGQYVPHKVVGTNNSVTTITTEDSEVIASEVELVKSGNNWRFLVKSTNQYLSAPSAEYRISYGAESSAASFSISSGSNGASIQTGSYYFYHSGSAGGFTLRTNSTANVRFYKLEASKQNQTLTFNDVTWTLGDTYQQGGTYTFPQAQGAVTTVTYSSDNNSVAEIVDATTNKVKIKGTGTAHITAAAAETASYYGTSATMTLTINPASSTPTPTESAYVKVTGEPENWAGTYLFVDETSSKAFAAFSGVTGNAVNVTINSDGTITSNSTVDTYALTVKDAGRQHGNSNVSNQEAYTIQNTDGKYIYVSQQAIQIGDTNVGGSGNYTYYAAFKYFSDASNRGVQVLSANNTGSTVYYLGYGNNAFSYEGGNPPSSANQARRVQLYKLTEGSGGGSGSTDPEKKNQTLTFAQSIVTLTMATASGTRAVQTVSGNQTPVTYRSSNSNVATVDGTTITIHGFGSTTITATAEANDEYNSGSAFYRLDVQQESATGNTERTYTYQTSASAGTYLIGGYESSGSQYSIALFPTVLTGNWSSSQGEVTNGEYIGQRDIDASSTLTFSNDSEIFNAEVELIASGSNWKIKILSTGKYLAVPTQDNRIVYVDSESSATAFSISGGSTSGWGGSSSSSSLGISSGNYYFYHSGSAHGFSMRAYQVTNIRLYKKTAESGTSGKQNQNPYFASNSVTETRAAASGTLQVQAVQGAYGTVTYSSSNENVATVNGTTITIHGFGQTTITANAAGNDNYNPGSASYILYVNQSTSSGERTYTYVAPGSLQEGTYLIAGSETNELSVALFPNVGTASWNSQTTGQVNNGQFIPHKVVGTNNSVTTITTEDSEIIASEVELVKSGNNWRFLVKSTNQYLSTPSAEYRISYGAESSAATFSVSSGTNGATVTVGSYYFYHSGSASGFTLRTNSTANVRFYQLTSGGDTPGKQYQTLSFEKSTDTYVTENASGTYPLQQVSGAHTTVSYSSSNENVATISGNTLIIHGFGSTEITANAIADDNYYSASKSYTLTVKRLSQTGVYNLENAAIEDYLDRAIAGYTYDNHGDGSGGGWWGGSSSNNGVSYVSDILRQYGSVSASNRLDWPAPVNVTWTQSVSNPSLSVYYDEAHTNEEIMAVTEFSSNSADIYNLIPGKTYYWVLKSGTSTITSGHFETTGRRRMMGIGKRTDSDYGQSHANNCRDLGGQVTTSGKTVKYGKIYRGSNMDNTTADTQNEKGQKDYIVNKMKIGLDVDLRTINNNSTSDTYQHNPLSSYGFENIPDGVASTYRGHTQEQYSSGSDLTTRSKMGPTLTRIFNAVHNNVNVYIHCMVGADRTGGTCLFLESLLGIAPERCDMDFEMTSFSCVGSRTRNGSSPEQYYTVYNAIKNTNTGNANSTWQEKAIYYCVNTLGVSRDLITQFQNDMLE